MEQVEKITQIAPWMLWVAVGVGIALCVIVKKIHDVVKIGREEKQRKDDHIREVAEKVMEVKAGTLADEISKKVMDAMQERFAEIDRKLGNDKRMIERQDRALEEHEDTLSQIANTLKSVDANIRDMREGFTYLARGTIASLNHQQHNGNSEEMEQAANELTRYLTKRPNVPMQ